MRRAIQALWCVCAYFFGNTILVEDAAANAEFFYLLAQARYFVGDLDEAEQLIAKAVEANGDR